MENKSIKTMKHIVIILPSEASMDKNEEFGLLPRWKRLMDEYRLYFDKIDVYTCDTKDFSEKLGVNHHPCRILVNKKYFKAISYNIWLMLNMGKMKADIIRFFGSVYPLMPVYQMLNKTPKVTSYQYDFYMKTLLDFGYFRGKIAYFAEKYSVKYVKNIITTTYELKDILRERYGITNNVVVNPNFVDLSTFTVSEDEQDYMFFAGRIFHAKGIDLIIEMMDQFKKEGRTTKFLLAGNGDVDMYQKMVDERHLNNQITFLGAMPSDKIAEYMRHCKVFVFPTTSQEGHPKALIEALASGAPCVATRVLGNTEVIQTKLENGILVEPRDLNGLIEAVKKVLDDESLRKKLKANAAKSAQKFDCKTVVANEICFIEKIIKDNQKKK